MSRSDDWKILLKKNYFMKMIAPSPSPIPQPPSGKKGWNYEVKDSSLSFILLWSIITRTVEKRYIGAEIN